MKDKCDKYETLFVFADDDILKEHLQECEDCSKEQEIMDGVSELISEVKPYYQKKKTSFNQLKVACILFALIMGGASLGIIGTNQEIAEYLRYGETLSAEELGFPVDSYGFLLVE